MTVSREALSPPDAPAGDAAAIPSVRARWPVLAGGFVVLLVVSVAAVSYGPVAIPWDATLRIFLSHLPGLDFTATWPQSWDTIIWDIRLPRVILAGLVGASLALSGATYQALFRNPLADPYLLGVAAGAALGASLALVYALDFYTFHLSPLTLMAFAGAVTTVGLSYSLARVGSVVPTTTLILAGVAVSSLAGAVTALVLITHNQQAAVILAWIMGSFNISHWQKLWLIVPYLVPGAVLILLYGRILNVMQLDEEQARQLGVDVERVKLLLIAAATLITAAAVSVSGLIGFVGLIVPHAVRLLWGPDYRRLLPMAMVSGATFLILADLIARTVAAPTELPVGVITAFCGVPFFLYLLRQQRVLM